MCDEGNSLRRVATNAIRATLLVTTDVVAVAPGTLPRSEYKSKLVDWSEAE